MFKKTMIPLIVAGFVMSAQAGDYDMDTSFSNVFVGIQLSGAWTQGSHLDSKDYKASGLGYGARLGAQNNEWRTLISIDKFDNSEINYKRAELHAQYLFTIPQMVDMGLHPFIGLNGGYAKYEAKGPSGKPKISESGFTYGGETGVVYSLSDQIDIDLTLQYSLSRIKELDHIGNIGFGINYKY